MEDRDRAVVTASDGASDNRGLVVLDRDGVLLAPVLTEAGVIRTPLAVGELCIEPTAAASVARLREAGMSVWVATNQPDVARGLLSESELAAMHDRILSAIPGIAAVLVCAHDNADRCACRKPLPGMLKRAQAIVGAEPHRSWMVGDRWTDIAAGVAAGFRTVLIESEHSWATTSSGGPPAGLVSDMTATSLAQAVELILAARDVP